MNTRNAKADLAAVRVEAMARMSPPTAGTGDAITVARAAELAEVSRRTWQRWENRGQLPRAVLDRFWRNVAAESESVARAKGGA